MCVYSNNVLYVFFFKQKTAYELRISDWSSDVCSSDLLVVALDSDDSLDTNALYAMALAWGEIPLPERSRFVAITGLCARPNGHIVGAMYPSDVFDATSLDTTFKYHVKGEKFGCLRTDVQLQFPFHEKTSEARSVGKGCASTVRAEWWPGK